MTTMNTPLNLGYLTNLEALCRWTPLTDKLLVDAGCGDMAFSRSLVDLGATVIAIDPDPIQAEKNRQAEKVPGLEFIEAGAEQIPVADSSIDGIIFSFSLHHVPATLHAAVIAEAVRVLKADGFLLVIEPMDCPLNQVMKLFHDEDYEREVAQQSLLKWGVPAFDSAEHVYYHSISQYDSWDAFAQHFASRSFNTLYSETDVRRPEVQAAFDRLGGPDHRFESPKQSIFFQGPKKERPSMG